ncbi:MAG TPA: sterol desaturase family protein [Candidatus Saccharimonadales bacterium]|nr:sterol desaturase family protein [Candidatus Saccharimonadales bacterium]
MMLWSWAAFWLTHLIFGMLFYSDDHVDFLPNHHVTTKQLLNTVGLNALLTFLFIPIANIIPTLIMVNDTFIGYISRILMALLIGDLIFYWTHRLFHHPFFYQIHKKHHHFVSPTVLAGLYCHPLEMLLSNHLAMVIPLKLIQSHSPYMLMFESSVVSLNILKSHSSNKNFLTGSPHHNVHHEKMSKNFGFSYITDILFGTYVRT